jgi:hypothetical protein
MRQLKPLCEESLDVEEAINWSLLMHRSLPHSTTNESPAYMTFGHDIVFKNTDEIMQSFRLNPANESRLQLLQRMRQEVIQKHLNTSTNLPPPEKEDQHRHFKLGDLVPLQLTDGQISNLSKIMDYGVKLTPQWSLPMRAIHVNRKGTTATLRCTSSGFTTQSHISRIQFINPPTTATLQAEWDVICRKEVNAFQVLSSYYSTHYEDEAEEETLIAVKGHNMGLTPDQRSLRSDDAIQLNDSASNDDIDDTPINNNMISAVYVTTPPLYEYCNSPSVITTSLVSIDDVHNPYLDEPFNSISSNECDDESPNLNPYKYLTTFISVDQDITTSLRKCNPLRHHPP